MWRGKALRSAVVPYHGSLKLVSPKSLSFGDDWRTWLPKEDLEASLYIQSIFGTVLKVIWYYLPNAGWYFHIRDQTNCVIYQIRWLILCKIFLPSVAKWLMWSENVSKFDSLRRRFAQYHFYTSWMQFLASERLVFHMACRRGDATGGDCSAVSLAQKGASWETERT